MRQLNEEEAKAFEDTEQAKCMDDLEIVKFQLYQELLCVSFERFHKALEKVLDRPVFTHEFAFTDILQEELETKLNLI